MADPFSYVLTSSGGYYNAGAYKALRSIDNYETDLAPYYQDGAGSATLTSAAARSGATGVEVDGFKRMWSMPGDGLDNYPSEGDSVEIFVNPRVVGDSSQYWVLFGTQHQTTAEDWYSLEMLMDGGFRIRIDEGGARSNLINDFNAGAYQADYYRLLLEWQNGIRATCYRPDNSIKSQIETTDQTFTSGGFGLRASGGATMYVDDARILPADPEPVA